MRQSSLCLVAALLCGLSSAWGMDVAVLGNTLILTGPVVGDELPKVKDAFAQNPSINVAVLRNSHGGNVPTGYRIGELFRQKGVTTLVSGYCVSSCSRMFLGGKQRLFSDDYPALQTYVGFHGHYDSTGRLNRREVIQQGLYDWVIRYSDGKADEALVKRWIDIERNTGMVAFMHPDVAQKKNASVFFCNGNESGRPLSCEPLATNALDRGIITDVTRLASPDQAQLPHKLRAQQYPASGFAELDDIGLLPLDAEQGLSNYQHFLDARFPRAFAVSPTRQHWAWNVGDNSVEEALQRCAERSGAPCKLYAVDEQVVYKP